MSGNTVTRRLPSSTINRDDLRRDHSSATAPNSCAFATKQRRVARALALCCCYTELRSECRFSVNTKRESFCMHRRLCFPRKSFLVKKVLFFANLYLLFPCRSNRSQIRRGSFVSNVMVVTSVIHNLQWLVGFVVAVEMLLDHVHLRVHMSQSIKKAE